MTSIRETDDYEGGERDLDEESEDCLKCVFAVFDLKSKMHKMTKRRNTNEHVIHDTYSKTDQRL